MAQTGKKRPSGLPSGSQSPTGPSTDPAPLPVAPRPIRGRRAATHDAVLALTTGSEPVGRVSVDGVLYDMADPARFTLRQAGLINRTMERIKALEAKKDPTEKDDRDYSSALRALAGQAVPDVPGEVWEKMGASQLADLAIAFFGLAALRSPRLSMLSRMRPAGTTRSRTSPGSTAEPQSAQATG